MALDMLVDAAQLDSALTSVADAIRAKGGTSAQLAFPAGFVSAVQAIPTGGGGGSEEAIIGRTFSGVYSNSTIEKVGVQGMSYITGLTGLNCPNLEEVGENGIRNTGLLAVNLPKLKKWLGTYSFGYNSSLKTFVAGALAMTTTPTHTFYNCTNLEAVDLSGSSVKLGNEVFHACSKLNVLIIRSANVATLASTGAFNGSAFASSGTGGTLYVPNALKATYQSASNWSTILGYTNNSIQAIEGSQYESYYADGTAV